MSCHICCKPKTTQPMISEISHCLFKVLLTPTYIAALRIFHEIRVLNAICVICENNSKHNRFVLPYQLAQMPLNFTMLSQ